MKRSTPLKTSKALQRKTPLKAGKALQAKTPLARSSTPLARVPMVQKRVKPKLTAVQKRPLIARSGGFCEIRKTGVCTGTATDVAHRIGEGSGGRHGQAAVLNDRLSNTLHACRRCHEWCHANVSEAEIGGWMLRNGDNPPAEGLLYAARGWRYLDDAGQVLPL